MDQSPRQVDPEPEPEPSDAATNHVATAWLLHYFLPALLVLVGFLVKTGMKEHEESQKLREQTRELEAQMRKDIESGSASEVTLRLMGVNREEYEKRRKASQGNQRERRPAQLE